MERVSEEKREEENVQDEIQDVDRGRKEITLLSNQGVQETMENGC